REETDRRYQAQRRGNKDPQGLQGKAEPGSLAAEARPRFQSFRIALAADDVTPDGANCAGRGVLLHEAKWVQAVSGPGGDCVKKNGTICLCLITPAGRPSANPR